MLASGEYKVKAATVVILELPKPVPGHRASDPDTFTKIVKEARRFEWQEVIFALLQSCYDHGQQWAQSLSETSKVPGLRLSGRLTPNENRWVELFERA